MPTPVSGVIIDGLGQEAPFATSVPDSTTSTLMGMRWITPSSTDISNNPELAPYGGLTNINSMIAFENTLRSVGGWTDNPILDMGHSYNSGGYSIAGFDVEQMTRYRAMVCNFKAPGGQTVANCQTTANGGHDSQIQSLINSIPAGKRVYMVWGHEPDFTTDADVAVWRAAFAHWAKYILDHRGTKDLHPTICFTTWSMRPANATVRDRYLRVTENLAALGIDWVNDVVMGPDGYQRDAAGVTGAETFANVFPQLYGLGWRRFGLSEFAACDKVGDAGGVNVTSADVAAADDWLKSVITWLCAPPYNAEYLNWFAPTGAYPPIGVWMYSTAVRKVWADACHYKGPAPGW